MRVAMLVLNDMTGDARVEREAAALADAGHTVRVFALQGANLAPSEDRGSYTVVRVAEQGSAGWSHPLAKIGQSSERVSRLRRAVTESRPAIVHCHDADTLAPGSQAAGACGARLVYDAGELYDEMLRANREHVSWLVLAHWRRVEARYARNADAVITVGDEIAKHLAERTGHSVSVVRSVPQLQPLGDRTRLRRHLGVGEDAVLLLYQGLLNVGRGLEAMIDLMPRVPDIHFVLQGSGPTQRSILERAAASPARNRIHYIGSMPVDELNEWAAGADIGDLLIENASLNNYLAAPNKLYQYMMAGIPQVASDFPEIAATLAEGPAGLVADPADSRVVIDALTRLVANPDERHRMGAAARRLAETKYNWDIEKQKLLDLYDRLAARSTS